MKIVDRKTLLSMPAGTVFSKYEPVALFGTLCVKGDSLSNDFYYQDITGPVDAVTAGECHEVMLAAEADGEPVPLDFHHEGRDGLYDANQLFAVWEAKDVLALIDRLHEAMKDSTCEG